MIPRLPISRLRRSRNLRLVVVSDSRDREAAVSGWVFCRKVERWSSTQSTVKSKVGFGRCCIGLHGTALHVASR